MQSEDQKPIVDCFDDRGAQKKHQSEDVENKEKQDVEGDKKDALEGEVSVSKTDNSALELKKAESQASSAGPQRARDRKAADKAQEKAKGLGARAGNNANPFRAKLFGNLFFNHLKKAKSSLE